MSKIFCLRNENPETCILCEEQGLDYCLICADGCTEEELPDEEKLYSHLVRKQVKKFKLKGL